MPAARRKEGRAMDRLTKVSRAAGSQALLGNPSAGNSASPACKRSLQTCVPKRSLGTSVLNESRRSGGLQIANCKMQIANLQFLICNLQLLAIIVALLNCPQLAAQE